MIPEKFDREKELADVLIQKAVVSSGEKAYRDLLSNASRLAKLAVITREHEYLELMAPSLVLCAKEGFELPHVYEIVDTVALLGARGSYAYSVCFQDKANALWSDVYQQGLAHSVLSAFHSALDVLKLASTGGRENALEAIITQDVILPNLYKLRKVPRQDAENIRKKLGEAGYEMFWVRHMPAIFRPAVKPDDGGCTPASAKARDLTL